MNNHELEIELQNADTIYVISTLNDHAQEIFKHFINRSLERINRNLDQPLQSFLILGETPYFNDGEECEHNFEIGYPHLVLEPGKKPYSHSIGHLLEREEYYSIIMRNFPQAVLFNDGYDYLESIEDGVAPNIQAWTTNEQRIIIRDVLESVNTYLESWRGTNYKVYGYYVNGEYDIHIEEHEPDY